MVHDVDDIYDINFLPLQMSVENFVSLKFQNGSIPERGHNGLTNEILLEVVADRMRRLNAAVPSDHTKRAISHVMLALSELEKRRIDRESRGVEGKSIA